MQRGAYVGEAGVLGGNSSPVIPVQAETTAYLGRFTSQPSAAYKAALNEFIFKCKRAGAWTVWQDLWLFVADTQADALRNIVTAARDATIGGSLTYTANRGFSGTFNGTNLISMPFSTSGITTSSGTIFAASVTRTGTGSIIGTDVAKVGSVTLPGASTNVVCGGATSGKSNIPAAATFACIGCNGVDGFGADGRANVGVVTTGIETSPVTTAAFISRLCAYGIAPTITASQITAFLVALNQFMADVGANP